MKPESFCFLLAAAVVYLVYVHITQPSTPAVAASEFYISKPCCCANKWCKQALKESPSKICTNACSAAQVKMEEDEMSKLYLKKTQPPCCCGNKLCSQVLGLAAYKNCNTACTPQQIQMEEASMTHRMV